MRILRKAAAALAIAAASSSVSVQASETLDAVEEQGFVQCGVSPGLPGFSNPDDQGDWSGLDVDFCRALAAAIFDDSEAVRFTPLSDELRFTALTSGEVDVLARNVPWTMVHDTDFGEFVGVNYHDGQGFMVPEELGVRSADELDDVAVCTGADAELGVVAYFGGRGVRHTIVATKSADEAVAAYESGRCSVYSATRTSIVLERARLARPDAHVILPELISQEPLGPLVRRGDPAWGDLARWTLNCMIGAEAKGITSANVEKMANSDDPGIRRILGIDGDLGSRIGLADEFCAQVIRHVGNYAESHERNVGPDTELGLERGLNALWSDGGLLYALPMR